jgi:hypothetical protein
MEMKETADFITILKCRIPPNGSNPFEIGQTFNDYKEPVGQQNLKICSAYNQSL